MPDASRARFGWVTWALAALPLTALAALGGLAMLFLVLRPRHTQPTSRGRVDVQLAVLGPPSVREWAMVGVLLLTVAGLIAAPALHMDVGVVAIIGLLGAVASGNFDRQSIRELDWDYLVFYGAALSLVRLGGTLGLDGLVGSAIGSRFAELGANSLMLVLAIAAVTIVVRLALAPDQAVLLLCLALIPSATALGLDPWIIVITILASTGLWLVPSQMPSYLAAYSASEGRLFSPSDAQRAAFGYAVVLLGALTVCAPYWRLLGLV